MGMVSRLQSINVNFAKHRAQDQAPISLFTSSVNAKVLENAYADKIDILSTVQRCFFTLLHNQSRYPRSEKDSNSYAQLGVPFDVKSESLVLRVVDFIAACLSINR